MAQELPLPKGDYYRLRQLGNSWLGYDLYATTSFFGPFHIDLSNNKLLRTKTIILSPKNTNSHATLLWSAGTGCYQSDVFDVFDVWCMYHSYTDLPPPSCRSKFTSQRRNKDDAGYKTSHIHSYPALTSTSALSVFGSAILAGDATTPIRRR